MTVSTCQHPPRKTSGTTAGTRAGTRVGTREGTRVGTRAENTAEIKPETREIRDTILQHDSCLLPSRLITFFQLDVLNFRGVHTYIFLFETPPREIWPNNMLREKKMKGGEKRGENAYFLHNW